MDQIRARWFGVFFTGIVLVGVVACGSDSRSAQTAAAPTTAAPMPQEPASTMETPGIDGVMVSFPDPQSVAEWRNVDDSVMGGVSASTSTWIDSGGIGMLEFTGDLSTERNGGFASTLGPVDRSLGSRASGSRALVVSAVGDGRTYLLQLRAGPSGTDRWISRFTPPVEGPEGAASSVALPLDSFESVNGFLRRIEPNAPLDPATITQIGVYLVDGQVGRFRLAISTIAAVG